MSLSATIVVHDDADCLDACLTSLHPLVDELVVVDTGSSDRSVAVAEAHGAVVAWAPESDDVLVAARNHALEIASSEWIVCIEADEHVDGDVDATRAFLERGDELLACRVPVVPRPGWTPRREHRVWRDRPDVRFGGPVIDTIVPAIAAAATAGAGRRVELLRTLRITPHPRAPRRPPRQALVERALLAALEQDPDQPRLLAQLAGIREVSGNRERAIATWKEGIERVRRRTHPLDDDRLLYAGFVQHLLARGVVDHELDAVVRDARDRFPRMPAVELAAARIAFAGGRPREALAPLEWLVALDDDAILAIDVTHDERVFGEWAWGLLGLCHFALGDDATAAEAFRRAEQLAPDDPSYGVRRRLAEARAATPTA